MMTNTENRIFQGCTVGVSMLVVGSLLATKIFSDDSSDKAISCITRVVLPMSVLGGIAWGLSPMADSPPESTLNMARDIFAPVVGGIVSGYVVSKLSESYREGSQGYSNNDNSDYTDAGFKKDHYKTDGHSYNSSSAWEERRRREKEAREKRERYYKARTEREETVYDRPDFVPKSDSTARASSYSPSSRYSYEPSSTFTGGTSSSFWSDTAEVKGENNSSHNSHETAEESILRACVEGEANLFVKEVCVGVENYDDQEDPFEDGEDDVDEAWVDAAHSILSPGLLKQEVEDREAIAKLKRTLKYVEQGMSPQEQAAAEVQLENETVWEAWKEKRDFVNKNYT